MEGLGTFLDYWLLGALGILSYTKYFIYHLIRATLGSLIETLQPNLGISRPRAQDRPGHALGADDAPTSLRPAVSFVWGGPRASKRPSLRKSPEII